MIVKYFSEKFFDFHFHSTLFFFREQNSFCSPVRMYRKSYCNHPGVSVGVHELVAQMINFLVKVIYRTYKRIKLMFGKLVDIGLTFYAVPPRLTLGDQGHGNFVLKV